MMQLPPVCHRSASIQYHMRKRKPPLQSHVVDQAVPLSSLSSIGRRSKARPRNRASLPDPFVYEEEEEEEEEERDNLECPVSTAVMVDCTRCGTCPQTDALVLLCDGCDRETHLACVEPPLDRVPDEDFFCRACISARKNRLRHKVTHDTLVDQPTDNKASSIAEASTPPAVDVASVEMPLSATVPAPGVFVSRPEASMLISLADVSTTAASVADHINLNSATVLTLPDTPDAQDNLADMPMVAPLASPKIASAAAAAADAVTANVLIDIPALESLEEQLHVSSSSRTVIVPSSSSRTVIVVDDEEQENALLLPSPISALRRSRAHAHERTINANTTPSSSSSSATAAVHPISLPSSTTAAQIIEQMTQLLLNRAPIHVSSIMAWMYQHMTFVECNLKHGDRVALTSTLDLLITRLQEQLQRCTSHHTTMMHARFWVTSLEQVHAIREKHILISL
jgi:hypothetical protein